MVKYNDLVIAINNAIDRCIKEDIQTEFFMKNRNEVLKMGTWDYTFERRLEIQRETSFEAGKQEGRQEGRREGREQTYLDLVDDGTLTMAQAAEKLGVTVDELKEKKQAMSVGV